MGMICLTAARCFWDAHLERAVGWMVEEVVVCGILGRVVMPRHDAVYECLTVRRSKMTD